MPSFLRPLRSFLAATLLIAAASCGGEEAPEAAIDRETFIETYVDLRAATMAGTGSELSREQRDAILEAHGVSEEDLLDFARVHGPDPVYMRDVWGDVEERLEAHGRDPSAPDESAPDEPEGPAA